MKELLQLITIAGVFLMAASILLSNQNIKQKISRSLTKERLIQRLESPQMKILFKESGLSISDHTVNLVRYGTVLGYIIIDFITRFLTKTSFSTLPLLIGLIIICLTAPIPFTPFSYILNKLKSRHSLNKDSELIGFMKFYENNLVRAHPLQLHVFVRKTAVQFNTIQKELFLLSEMLIDKNLEESLDWWVKNYPEGHPFINEIRTIILSTQNTDHLEAKRYIESQAKYLSQLASDQYKKKGMFAGDIAKILNSAPSILSFIMITIFAFMYLMIIRSQSSFY